MNVIRNGGAMIHRRNKTHRWDYPKQSFEITYTWKHKRFIRKLVDDYYKYIAKKKQSK
jgi:hypothetical protein